MSLRARRFQPQRHPTGPWKACASKVRYRTEHEAVGVGRRCEALRGRGLRAYECPFCAGWHLTRRREWVP